MSIQLALRFDEAPITCETQQRYHSIAACLAGKRSAEEQAMRSGFLTAPSVVGWGGLGKRVYQDCFQRLTIHVNHKLPNGSSWRCFMVRVGGAENLTRILTSGGGVSRVSTPLQ
jgi:hypothetical protein